MDHPSPIDVIAKALKRYAKNGGLIGRVEDGKIHEEQILAAVYEFLVSEGVNASLVEYKASNQPLCDRELDFKPKGYQFKNFGVLEVEGEVLALRFAFPCGNRKSRLIASRYSSRAHARKNLAPLEYFEWKPHDNEFPKEDMSYLITPDLRAELRSAVIAQQTPQAPARKPSSGRL